MDTIGFKNHDHATCIAQGLQDVDKCCQDRGLQFTPVRRRVLEILLQRHSALGAYEILDVLREEGLGSQPPVAYRALDFLVKNGFAHKIEQLNAFIACTHPGTHHAPAFMICRICRGVAESDTAPDKNLMASTADAAGFIIEKTVVEVEGVCPNCQKQAQT